MQQDTPITQENDACAWHIDLQGPHHVSGFNAPAGVMHVMLYPTSDPYYALVFHHRPTLEAFVAQLTEAADAIWPRP
jgi:hypothetical protein